MIYYDPSEARVGTKLPNVLVERGEPLEGLEQKTGGDLLVTARTVPGGSVLRPPGSVLLEKATGNAFLIQRKTGMDMLSSIPNLEDVARRMLAWPSMAFLVPIGWFEPTTSEKVVVNGRETGWNWRSYQGALSAWQIWGGKVREEKHDEGFVAWVIDLEEKWLKKLERSEVWTQPKQDTSHLKLDKRPWRAVLEGFPGVGPTLSYQIADYCGDLKTALWWMSDETLLPLKGIGVETRMAWRKFMSLKDDQVMAIVDRETGEVKDE